MLYTFHLMGIGTCRKIDLDLEFRGQFFLSSFLFFCIVFALRKLWQGTTGRDLIVFLKSGEKVITADAC